MDMKALSEKMGLSFLAEPWLLQVVLVVLVVVLANIVSQFLLRYAGKIVRLTSSPWDDALIQAAKRPVPIVIWLVGIAFAASIMGKETHAAIIDAVPAVRNIGVVVCLAWFLIRFIRNATNNVVAMHREKSEEMDSTTIDALSKLACLTVIITASLVAMQTLGFSITGVLTAGGISGIAIGFAAKDLLANFFGGALSIWTAPSAWGTGSVHRTRISKALWNASVGATPVCAVSIRSVVCAQCPVHHHHCGKPLAHVASPYQGNNRHTLRRHRQDGQHYHRRKNHAGASPGDRCNADADRQLHYFWSVIAGFLYLHFYQNDRLGSLP